MRLEDPEHLAHCRESRDANDAPRKDPRLGGSQPANEEETVAALALEEVPRFRGFEKAQFVRDLGSCQQALTHLPGGVPAEILSRAEKQIMKCRKAGFSIVILTDPHYPQLLKDISDPPLALYVWGSLDPVDAVSLAVVGSRRATPYGIEACECLSGELAQQGATIVSGLARGIDATAHRAALEVGGRTIAVLGSGIDVVYPREHRRLAERIAERAAVISEFPLSSPPLPGHFPRRNRIVSGLALGTIVIEAAEKSGSLISARFAVEENREVFAVPGPITSVNSRGVHRLIQDGAKLVTETRDIVEEMRPDIQKRLSGGAVMRQSTPTEMGELGQDERGVLKILDTRGATDADHLVRLSQMPVDRVMAALVALEIQGRVRAYPGGIYGARKPR